MKARDALLLSASPLVNAALTFITIPLLSWFLPPSEVGKYSLILISLGLAFAALNLGLDQAFVREYYETTDKKQLLRNCVYPGLLLGALIYSGFIFSGQDLAKILIDSEGSQANLFLYLIIAANFFLQYILLVLRLSAQSLKYLLCSTLPKLLFLISALILLYSDLQQSKTIVLWSYLVAYGLSLFAAVASNVGSAVRFFSIIKIHIADIQRLLRFSLPLYLSTLFFWLINISDRLYIKTLVSFDALGKYSLAMSIAGVATLLQAMFSTVWTPLVYQWVAEGINLEKYNNLRRSILSLCILAYCVVALCAPYIMKLLPPSYAEVSMLIPACFGAQIFFLLSEMNVVGVYIKKKTSFSLAATSLTLGMNIFLNYYFILHLNIAGAAIALNLSFVMLYLLRTWGSNYVWQRTRSPEGWIWILILSALSIWQALSNRSEQLYYLLLWLLLLIICVFYFKHSYRQIFNFLLTRINRKFTC